MLPEAFSKFTATKLDAQRLLGFWLRYFPDCLGFVSPFLNLCLRVLIVLGTLPQTQPGPAVLAFLWLHWHRSQRVPCGVCGRLGVGASSGRDAAGDEAGVWKEVERSERGDKLVVSKFRCWQSTLLECHQGIACEDLDNKIKAGLDKLDGTAGIEEVELAAWLNSMYEGVNKIPGIECLQGRRAVKMTYRKLTISVMVADPAEQVTLSLRLRVRERAAMSDKIALLPGEGVLDAGQDHPWTSGTSAVSKAHKARLQLTRLLQAEPEDTVSGDTVLVPS